MLTIPNSASLGLRYMKHHKPGRGLSEETKEPGSPRPGAYHHGRWAKPNMDHCFKHLMYLLQHRTDKTKFKVNNE